MVPNCSQAFNKNMFVFDTGLPARRVWRLQKLREFRTLENIQPPLSHLVLSRCVRLWPEVCGNVLADVGLFSLALVFLILMFATAISPSQLNARAVDSFPRKISGTVGLSKLKSLQVFFNRSAVLLCFPLLFLYLRGSQPCLTKVL